MNLSGFRDAIATHFTSEFSTLNVSAHGGEFDSDSVRRYSKSDPALVLSLIDATTDSTPIGDGILFNAKFAAVVMARSRAGEAKDARVLRIATFIMRELAKTGQVYNISEVQVQAPRNINGRNLYSAELDKQNIALFGITWDQAVELTADVEAEFDAFETLHIDYNLGPEPDDDYEAEDDIDLT